MWMCAPLPLPYSKWVNEWIREWIVYCAYGSRQQYLIMFEFMFAGLCIISVFRRTCAFDAFRAVAVTGRMCTSVCVCVWIFVYTRALCKLMFSFRVFACILTKESYCWRLDRQPDSKDNNVFYIYRMESLPYGNSSCFTFLKLRMHFDSGKRRILAQHTHTHTRFAYGVTISVCCLPTNNKQTA